MFHASLIAWANESWDVTDQKVELISTGLIVNLYFGINAKSGGA